jgi:hypothetical protein
MCFRKNYRVNMKKGLIFKNEPFFTTIILKLIPLTKRFENKTQRFLLSVQFFFNCHSHFK